MFNTTTVFDKDTIIRLAVPPTIDMLNSSCTRPSGNTYVAKRLTSKKYVGKDLRNR